MDEKTQRETFEQYFRWRAGQAGAITLGQKLNLVRQLRRQAHETGEFPLGPYSVAQLTPTDPQVQAVLAGESVSVGGERVAEQRQGLAGMSAGVKIGIAALAVVLMVGLYFGIMQFAGRRRRGEDAIPIPTATVVGLPATQTHTTTAIVATPSPTPVLTAAFSITSTVTPTPYTLALGLVEAAEGGNDPASVEWSGFSFVLSEGEARNGVWQPAGAEWLAGTELRRVVAVPYSPDLANAAARLREGATIHLRLRSGEVVEYRVTEVKRVARHQIEVLTGRTPSIAVVLYGERTGERTVVLGEAVQRPEDFVVYTPVPLPTTPTVSPTPIPLTTTQIVTDTQVVTNTTVGLVLYVSPCNRVMRVGEQEPPRSNQQFLICPVRLRAMQDGAAYSGQALAVTEYDWITEAVDWWPQPVSVSGALSDGVLNTGDDVSGKVAGVVIKPALGRRSEPVLVWEQAGVRYVVLLNP